VSVMRVVWFLELVMLLKRNGNGSNCAVLCCYKTVWFRVG